MIMNFSGKSPSVYPTSALVHEFSLNDSETENISVIMLQVYSLIQSTIAADSNAKILFSCLQGISRSVAVMIFCLMKLSTQKHLFNEMPKPNMTLKEAFREVKSKRRVALPNVGFMKQLSRAEEELYGEPSSLTIGPQGQLIWR